MKTLALVSLCSLSVAAAAAALPPSLQGVPGLYEVHSTMRMNLPESVLQGMPASVREKLSGQTMPGMNYQFCVPQKSGAGLAATMHMGPECRFSHVRQTAVSYHADVTCHDVTMHLAMAEKGPETRAFSVTMDKVPEAPSPGPMTVTYVFHRLSASCGDLQPNTMRMPDGKVVAVPQH